MTDVYEKTLKDRIGDGLDSKSKEWLRKYGCEFPNVDDDKLVAIFGFLVSRVRESEAREVREQARADAHKTMQREISEAHSTLGRLLDGPPEEFIRVMQKVDEL